MQVQSSAYANTCVNLSLWRMVFLENRRENLAVSTLRIIQSSKVVFCIMNAESGPMELCKSHLWHNLGSWPNILTIKQVPVHYVAGDGYLLIYNLYTRWYGNLLIEVVYFLVIFTAYLMISFFGGSRFYEIVWTGCRIIGVDFIILFYLIL